MVREIFVTFGLIKIEEYTVYGTDLSLAESKLTAARDTKRTPIRPVELGCSVWRSRTASSSFSSSKQTQRETGREKAEQGELET